MKNGKIKLSVIFLLGIMLNGLHAQSTLYVREITGKQTALNLNIIRKLTFNNGAIAIHKTSGDSSLFNLKSVRYLNFTDLTGTVTAINTQNNRSIGLYPNPAEALLNISYSSKNDENISMQIIDLQGKIMIQQKLVKNSDNNIETIDVSKLSKGLYICRIQSSNKFETLKFIKK